jgi:hypothetical protein
MANKLESGGHTPPEKFTRYFNVLEACKRKGCPACTLTEQSVRRHIDNVLYENVNDPDTRIALRSSWGMCASHADVLLKAGDAFGISILYEDIIREVRSVVTQQSVRALNGSRACPVCQFKLSQENHCIKIFADHVMRQELQDALKQSSGLCLLHLRAVGDCLRDEKAQRWLRALHAEKLGTLRVHMREFIRKHEMQYSHEATTEVERQSCVVAINTLIGMNA